MADESRVSAPETKPWEDRGGIAASTILATAVAAGVVAFLLRRSREDEQPTSRVARFARDWAGSDGVEAGRDFVVGKVLPELKPALLSVLGEVEDVIDQAFRRAEKTIKRL